MRVDATGGTSAVLLGLLEFIVLSAGELAGEVELLVETTAAVTGGTAGGVVAEPHGRWAVLVRDLPAAGRPVLLVWSKRLWRCPERLCPQRTWSETTEQVAPRAVLTERARQWAMLRVGRHRKTVASVARQLGVGYGPAGRRPAPTRRGERARGRRACLGARRPATAHRLRDRDRRHHPRPAAAAARRRRRAQREGVRRLARRAGGGLAGGRHGRRPGPVPGAMRPR